MELTTIIGLVSAFFFMYYGAGDVRLFLDFPSFVVTVGGTVATIFIRYPFNMIANLFPVYKKAFVTKLDSTDDMIKKIISLSVEAKKNGILGLEKVKIENPFLKKGVQLAIDGVEPELIEAVLNIDIASTAKRHETCMGMLLTAGDAAPAFGMIGTLLGLISMLANMDDPKGLGPAMALALITTLYGSLMANILFVPMADKLKYFHEQEMQLRSLIVNGILSIANGDHPAVVQEKLSSFLKPDARKILDATLKTRGG